MALMCASRDNDFSAIDSGVKVPTHLIEAMVQFLVSASPRAGLELMTWRGSRYHYTTPRHPAGFLGTGFLCLMVNIRS